MEQEPSISDVVEGFDRLSLAFSLDLEDLDTMSREVYVAVSRGIPDVSLDNLMLRTLRVHELDAYIESMVDVVDRMHLSLPIESAKEHL